MIALEPGQNVSCTLGQPSSLRPKAKSCNGKLPTRRQNLTGYQLVQLAVRPSSIT